jgi:hypothetical protein
MKYIIIRPSPRYSPKKLGDHAVIKSTNEIGPYFVMKDLIHILQKPFPHYHSYSLLLILSSR